MRRSIATGATVVALAILFGCLNAESKPKANGPPPQTPPPPALQPQQPQQLPPRTTSGRMVDPIYFVATMMIAQVGQRAMQGTGFFYASAGLTYLVTNRHVVDPSFGTPPVNVQETQIQVRLHADRNDLTKNDIVTIPLLRDGKPLWHVDPKPTGATGRAVDVAVIEVDQALFKRFIVTVLTSADAVPKNVRVPPGEDILIVGYPLAFYDAVHNFPIVRTGSVASAFGVPFQGSPLFLADANIHPGMSGGPAFTKATTAIVDESGQTSIENPTTYFLGINSSTRSAQTGPTEVTPLGLCDIWYAEEIEKLIGTFAKKHP